MRQGAFWLVGTTWLGCVLLGFFVWDRFDWTAGGVGQARDIPEAGPARWRLVLFAHPHCPCLRASLAELAEVVQRAPNLSVRVVFVRPERTSEGWERGSSWEAASRMTGVETSCDADGAEARSFGAETSGHAELIDPLGRVVFRGGLTSGRGRNGESAGRRAILDWIEHNAGAASAPVYGCLLFDSDE